MRFGTLTLQSNLFLSPLAGYTNLPFRIVARELGGVGLATTDLVNARSLLEKRPKALKLIETCPADRPLAVQLFGAVPEEMREAAMFLESAGIAVVDVNMGCPVPKVCRVGSGSAMMTELDKTARLVKGMVESVKIPVTAKMRLGWDEQNITAPDLARALEDVGVAAIFVHGRTREQGFGGRVNLAGIQAVVRAVKSIPVIGNGDITTPQAAKKMLDETGCAGVSIGRGAFYDPWIFKRTLHYLRTSPLASDSLSPRGTSGSGSDSLSPRGTSGERAGERGTQPESALLPEPTFDERVRVMCRHLDLTIQVFGEERGCRMFRKIAPWYCRRFGPAHEFNKQVTRICSKADFHDALDHYRRWRQQFLDDHGELLPRFRPAPLVASFMQESADGSLSRDASAGARPRQVPVPKGPVEVW